MLRVVLANMCVRKSGPSSISDPHKHSNCIHSSEVVEDDRYVSEGSDENVLGNEGVDVDHGIIEWDDTNEVSQVT